MPFGKGLGFVGLFSLIGCVAGDAGSSEADTAQSISTEPVIEVVRTRLPKLLWVSDVVAAFILISIAYVWLVAAVIGLVCGKSASRALLSSFATHTSA